MTKLDTQPNDSAFASPRALDASAEPRIGFDLGTRSHGLRAQVTARLDELGITYDARADGFVMVPAAAEVHVDQVIDAGSALVDDGKGPAFAGVKILDLVGTPAVDPVTPWPSDVAGVLWPSDVAGVLVALAETAEALAADPRDAGAQAAMLAAERAARELQTRADGDVSLGRDVLDQCAVLVALIEDAGEEHLVEQEAELLVTLVTVQL